MIDVRRICMLPQIVNTRNKETNCLKLKNSMMKRFENIVKIMIIKHSNFLYMIIILSLGKI